MSTTFNPDDFMNQAVGEGSTTVTPIPPGEYYATIEKVEPKPYTRKDTGEGGINLMVTFKLMDDNGSLAEQIGRPPMVTQSYFTDLSPSGGLDMGKGKNIQINRLRDALGQNAPNWTPGMLQGAGPCKVVVSNDLVNDVLYSRIKSVGKM